MPRLLVTCILCPRYNLHHAAFGPRFGRLKQAVFVPFGSTCSPPLPHRSNKIVHAVTCRNSHCAVSPLDLDPKLLQK